MKSGHAKKRRDRSKLIAAPGVLLKAAQDAPTVFSIGPYFPSLYVMRNKGHSWRFLADEWLRKFNIYISHVHLHRLYTKEDARLDRLTATALRKLGMPEDMIAERNARDDPTKRLVALDPEDEPDEDDEDRR
jgi:hypothetical protein